MANAGRVAIVPKGEYSATVAYKRLDLVRYNNDLYVAKKANTGVAPTDSETWMLSLENVSQTQYDNLINGTTAVGNALKLNGLTAGEFVSNENLLINADFKNPVNSSGKTKYSGNQWTIDKWFTNYDTSVTVNDGYITVKGDNDIKQTNTFPSGAYTLSFKARSTDGATMYVTVGQKIGNQINLTTEWKTYTFTSTNDTDFTSINFRIGTASKGKGLSFDLEWAKLEKGSIATPFIPQNKEVEKLKCGVGNADTVDGLHASDFLRLVGSNISPSDYSKTRDEFTDTVPLLGELRFTVYPQMFPNFEFPEGIVQTHYYYLSINKPAIEHYYVNIILKDLMTGEQWECSKSYGMNGWTPWEKNFTTDGGTLTKAITTPLEINNTTSGDTQVGISFLADSKHQGNIGFNNGNPSVYVTKLYSWQDLLHTGNKPKGHFTGTGDASPRTISIGGIPYAILIVHGEWLGQAIITPSGAIVSKGSSVYTLSRDEVRLDGDSIIIVTNDDIINQSGKVIYWHVL